MPLIIWPLFLLFSIIQFFAFVEGAEVWLGVTGIGAVIGFAILYVLGPLGGVFIAIVGYFGATRGWGWEWWQAALVCFPYLVLGFLAMALTGVLALFLGWRLTGGARKKRTYSFSRGAPLQKVPGRRRSRPTNPPE